MTIPGAGAGRPDEAFRAIIVDTSSSPEEPGRMAVSGSGVRSTAAWTATSRWKIIVEAVGIWVARAEGNL